MTDSKLKQLVAQVEQVDAEILDKREYRKDLIKAVKSEGYDTAAFNRVIRERRMDAAKLSEHEQLYTQYKFDLGMED